MTNAEGDQVLALPGSAWSRAENAAAYERGRPGYAPAAIAWLAKVFHVVPATRVLDLGAGTGKLARQLRATGAQLVAVEPIAEMRRQFSAMLRDVPVLEGSAEAIPLPAKSIDLVVVGQAWHWFNGPGALKEVERVLVDGGGLALLWNDYDTSVPWAQELAEIRNRHFSQGLPPQAEREWQSDFAGRKDWTALQQRTFDHLHHTSREALVDRVLSTSVIAGLPVNRREEVRREVLAILDRYTETRQRDHLAVPYHTDLFWTEHALDHSVPRRSIVS